MDNSYDHHEWQSSGAGLRPKIILYNLGDEKMASSLIFQMVGMIRILAGIAPGDVHFARGQVEHHGIDRFLAVESIVLINGVIANGIREIYMVFLNALQRLNGMNFTLV